jgi:hypothetical protein
MSASTRLIDFPVAFGASARFPCPPGGTAPQPVHDTRERSWRHLNFFHAYLHAQVPHVCCQGCGKVAAQAYSKEFEAEADYVGLYIMARGGLNIDKVPQLGRRMAAANPRGIRRSYAASHPASAERFLALQKTAAEIHKKQAVGLPLMPEYKNG